MMNYSSFSSKDMQSTEYRDQHDDKLITVDRWRFIFIYIVLLGILRRSFLTLYFFSVKNTSQKDCTFVIYNFRKKIEVL